MEKCFGVRLQEGVRLYREILCLTETIKDLLEQGQPERLAFFLAQKEKLLRQAATLLPGDADVAGETADTANPEPSPGEALQELLQLGREILRLDRENERLLKEKLAATHQELQSLQKSKKARVAYSGEGGWTTRFIDQKK